MVTYIEDLHQLGFADETSDLRKEWFDRFFTEQMNLAGYSSSKYYISRYELDDRIKDITIIEARNEVELRYKINLLDNFDILDENYIEEMDTEEEDYDNWVNNYSDFNAIFMQSNNSEYVEIKVI